MVSDASGQHLSVVNGFNGGVYTSNDYGDTWTQASTAMIRIDNYDIYCITSSANGKRLVAASWDNVWSSADYGGSWTKNYHQNGWWFSITSSASGQYVAAVDLKKGIYVSENYGQSWNITSAPVKNWQMIISDSTGQYLVAVIAFGEIYVSKDYGFTWQQTLSLKGGWCIASDASGQHVVAVMFTNKLYASDDYGESWSLRFTFSYSTILNALASDASGKRLLAVDEGGEIYTSTDGGATWTNQEPVYYGTYQPLWNMATSSSSGERLVIVDGRAGGIYTSQDYGTTWNFMGGTLKAYAYNYLNPAIPLMGCLALLTLPLLLWELCCSSSPGSCSCYCLNWLARMCSVLPKSCSYCISKIDDLPDDVERMVRRKIDSGYESIVDDRHDRL